MPTPDAGTRRPHLWTKAGQLIPHERPTASGRTDQQDASLGAKVPVAPVLFSRRNEFDDRSHQPATEEKKKEDAPDGASSQKGFQC